MDRKTAIDIVKGVKTHTQCQDNHMRWCIAVASGETQAAAYLKHINDQLTEEKAKKNASRLLADHPQYREVIDKLRAEFLIDEMMKIKTNLAKAAQVGILTATSQVLNDGEHKHFANTLNTILKSYKEYVAPTPPPTNNIQVNIDTKEVKGAQDILDSLDMDQNEPDPEII